MQQEYRTNYCGDLSLTDVSKKVKISGWVHYRRDLGGLIFLEIRDHKGLIQVVANPDSKSFVNADKARKEYVICVRGTVSRRPEGTENKETKTGEIEIISEEIKILSKTSQLPFYPDEHQGVSEEVRLKYRYIDLRRSDMFNNLLVRCKVKKAIRDFLEKENFLDLETPMLTKATPEGARDYLVPSRTHQGSFFALPQSPQLFKQLLMIAGFDKYYQIIRCFRDEDLRADRQPEFTQLDLEMSFVNEEDIMDVIERLMKKIFKEVLNVEFTDPFLRMTYKEAMDKFGCDKPDLRNPLKLCEVSDLLKNVDFKVFATPANDPDSRVAVICVPDGSTKLTRKDIDDYTKFVSIYGAKGLAYIKINDLEKGIDGLQSPILKFLTDDVIRSILKRVNAKNGDILFFGADKAKVVNESLSALRDKIGADLNLLQGKWEPLWVIDFPMFEWNDIDKRWDSLHHPFTSPKVNSVAEFKGQEPKESLSRAYDLVLNGVELGSGSIRIHEKEMQSAAFSALGINDVEAKEKFGFLLKAFEAGAPPHGGMALGLDRLCMLLTGMNSIREVIPFPKTQTAACPLTEAPSFVDDKQLFDLGINVVIEKDEKK